MESLLFLCVAAHKSSDTKLQVCLRDRTVYENGQYESNDTFINSAQRLLKNTNLRFEH